MAKSFSEFGHQEVDVDFIYGVNVSMNCANSLMVLLKALKHLEGSRDPLPDSKQGFYLLIETTGSSQNHDRCVSVQCHPYVIYWGICLVNRYFFSYMCKQYHEILTNMSISQCFGI